VVEVVVVLDVVEVVVVVVVGAGCIATYAPTPITAITKTTIIPKFMVFIKNPLKLTVYKSFYYALYHVIFFTHNPILDLAKFNRNLIIIHYFYDSRRKLPIYAK